LPKSNKKEKEQNGDRAGSEMLTETDLAAAGSVGPAEPDNASGQLNSKSALVDKMIRSIETKLESQEIKATLSDFIRLLQLQKELAEEKPREITVRWVEPLEKESVS